MDGVSVSKLSRDIGVPVTRLLQHLNEVGCSVERKSDLVTGKQQLLLRNRLHEIESVAVRKKAVSLEDLRNATTLLELNNLLTQSITKHQIHALIKEKNLDVVINLILDLNRRRDQELLAAAMLGRLAAVLRGGERASLVFHRVNEVISREPPSIETLEDGDGRTKAYAAAALCQIDTPWIPKYLAREAVLIDTADNARRELLTECLRRESSISKWVSAIAAQAVQLREIPPVRRQNRIRRIFDSMRQVVQQWRGDVGSDAGVRLAESLRAFLRPMKLNELDESKLFAIADSLISILCRVIELRFSTALDADTYQLIDQGKKTFGAGLWGRFVRASNILPELRTSLLESALVLARQNRTDKQISTVLAASYTSYPQASRAIGRHLKTAQDLDPDIARWWSKIGKVSDSKSPVQQKVGNTEDSQIGALLIQVDRNRDAMEKIERAVVPGLEISDNVLASTVRKAVKRYRDIDQTVRRLARLRKLRKKDSVGEIVEYNPLEHELLEGHRTGVRSVKIVREGILKDFGGRVKTLVKPWVEAVGD